MLIVHLNIARDTHRASIPIIWQHQLTLQYMVLSSCLFPNSAASGIKYSYHKKRHGVIKSMQIYYKRCIHVFIRNLRSINIKLIRLINE